MTFSASEGPISGFISAAFFRGVFDPLSEGKNSGEEEREKTGLPKGSPQRKSGEADPGRCLSWGGSVPARRRGQPALRSGRKKGAGTSLIEKK